MCMKNAVIKYSTLRWCDNRRAVHAEMLPFCEYADCLSCHCCCSANTQHSVTLSEEILTRDRDISYGFSYRSTHISPLCLCSCSTHKQQQWSGAVLCWLLLPLDNKTDVRCDVERKKCLETSSATTTSDSAVAIAVAKTKQISMWEERRRMKGRKKSIWLSIEKSSHHKFIWMWKNNTTRIQTILYSALSSSDEERGEQEKRYIHPLLTEADDVDDDVAVPLALFDLQWEWNDGWWEGFSLLRWIAGNSRRSLCRVIDIICLVLQPTNKYKDFMYHG